MMSDNRIGHNNRNHPLDAGPNSRVDLLLRSESPRVQQILLHQELKEYIEKNSSGRVKYIDSELYLRNNGRSPALGSSEVQSTTLNIGIASTTKQSNKLPATASSGSTTKREGDRDLNIESADPDEGNRHQQQAKINRNCQVCLIKEVRQDLMNINKIVQERNEQISNLKDKCLRSYFERQMMD